MADHPSFHQLSLNRSEARLSKCYWRLLGVVRQSENFGTVAPCQNSKQMSKGSHQKKKVPKLGHCPNRGGGGADGGGWMSQPAYLVIFWRAKTPYVSRKKNVSSKQIPDLTKSQKIEA
jgi:hypothetical protein